MTLFAQTDEDGSLVVGPEKANSAAPPPRAGSPSRKQKFAPTDDHDGTVALLEYDRFSDTTIREHVEAAAAAQASATTRGDANDAAVWLALQLAGGPRWSVDVQTAAGCDRISDKRLRAAKLKCRVQSAREGGTGPWFMFLPQHSGRLPGLQMSRQMSTFSEGTSGTSGTSGQKSDVPVDQPRCSDVPSGIYGTPGEGHQTCACGAQLTKPASIRYGRCYECRTIARPPSAAEKPRGRSPCVGLRRAAVIGERGTSPTSVRSTTMTLPQAALSVPDETAASIVSAPRIDRFHLEPRCRVCQKRRGADEGQRPAGLRSQLRHDPARPRGGQRHPRQV